MDQRLQSQPQSFLNDLNDRANCVYFVGRSPTNSDLSHSDQQNQHNLITEHSQVSSIPSSTLYYESTGPTKSLQDHNIDQHMGWNAGVPCIPNRGGHSTNTFPEYPWSASQVSGSAYPKSANIQSTTHTNCDDQTMPKNWSQQVSNNSNCVVSPISTTTLPRVHETRNVSNHSIDGTQPQTSKGVFTTTQTHHSYPVENSNTIFERLSYLEQLPDQSAVVRNEIGLIKEKLKNKERYYHKNRPQFAHCNPSESAANGNNIPPDRGNHIAGTSNYYPPRLSSASPRQTVRVQTVETESLCEYVQKPSELVQSSEVVVHGQSSVQFQDKESTVSGADHINGKYLIPAPLAGVFSDQARLISHNELADTSSLSTCRSQCTDRSQTQCSISGASHCESNSYYPLPYPTPTDHDVDGSNQGLPRNADVERVQCQNSSYPFTTVVSSSHPTIQYHNVTTPAVADTPEWPVDDSCSIPNGFSKMDSLAYSLEKCISTAEVNQDVIINPTQQFTEASKVAHAQYTVNQPYLLPGMELGTEQQPPHGLPLSGLSVPTSRLDSISDFAGSDHSTYTPILPKGSKSPTQVSTLPTSNITLSPLLPPGSPRKRQSMDRETRNERRRQQRLRKKQERQQNLEEQFQIDANVESFDRLESERVRVVPQTEPSALEVLPTTLSKRRLLPKSTKMTRKKQISGDTTTLTLDSPKTDSGTSVGSTKKRRMSNRKTMSEVRETKKVKRGSDKEDGHEIIAQSDISSFETAVTEIPRAKVVRARPPKPKKKRPLPILIRKRKRSHFYGDDSESDPDIAGRLGIVDGNPTVPGKGGNSDQQSGAADKRRSERTAGDRKRYALDVDLNLSDGEEGESDDLTTTDADNAVGPVDMEEREIVKVVESVLGRRMAKRIVKKKQTESVQEIGTKDFKLRTALEKGCDDDEEEEEDVEEFYLKYKGFSYLHCEWRALDEIDDPRIRPKLRRFEMKQTNTAAQTEDDDMILFNPDYVEVERVLDMQVYRDGQLISTDLLAKSSCALTPTEHWRKTKHRLPCDMVQIEPAPILQTGCVAAKEELIKTVKKGRVNEAAENTEKQETEAHLLEGMVQSQLDSDTELVDNADEDNSPYSPIEPTEKKADSMHEVASTESKCSSDEHNMEITASVHSSVDCLQEKSDLISEATYQIPAADKPDNDCDIFVDYNRRGSDEEEDEDGSRTPVSVTYYLVKWRSLPYEDATWELAQDVDPAKVKEFLKWRQPPSTDLLQRDSDYKVIRPDPSLWRPIKSEQTYKNNNKLRYYQLEGVNWLTYCWFHHRNCILADEMGLGKTVQSVAFLLELEKVGIRGPFIVIVPLSTVSNWQREFENWSNFNVVVYHGSTASRNMIQMYEIFYPLAGDSGPGLDRNSLRHDVYKFHALVTTFEILMTDIEFFGQIHWAAAIIDEAHRLKNKKCKLGEGLRYLDLDHRVLLTGTPLQNNVEELFGLLNFLEPVRFNCSSTFVAEYGDLKTEEQVESLKNVLKPMMLRRLKEDVEKGLAPKEETIVEVELTNIQKKYYRAIMERNFSFLCKGSTHSNAPNLMNVMMELRKCCNHPFLIKGAEDAILEDMQNQHSPDQGSTDESVTFQALVYSSGKLVLIHKLLPKLRANGHKVLVFSQMIRVLDILEDYLIYQRFPFERIDGRIQGPLRQEAIDRFTADPDKFVFLLCTKAGGLGINLTAADVVIIYDSDWNPQNDLQAQARCHRIGQRKMVKVYRLITRNTYEREMFDRASLKLGLDRAVLQSMGSKEARQAQMTKKEIEELLKKGAYGALMDDDKAGEDFCEEDIDKILQSRSRVVQLEQGEKNSTFSKATFSVSNNRSDIELDDPNFWQKWAKMAGVDEDDSSLKDLIMKTPRIRRQTSRYTAVSANEPSTASPASYDVSELEDSANAQSSGDDTAPTTSNNRGRFRRTRKQRRQQKGSSGNATRRDSQPSLCDTAELDITEPLDRADLFRVERCLLTWAWSHWDVGLSAVPFKRLLKPSELSYFACAVLGFASRFMPSNADPRLKATIFELSRPGVWNRNITEIARSVSIASRKETLRSNCTGLNLTSNRLNPDSLMTEVGDSLLVGSPATPAVVNSMLPDNTEVLSNTTARTPLTEHDAAEKVSDSPSITTNADDSVDPPLTEAKGADKLSSLDVIGEGEAVQSYPEKPVTEFISPKTAGFDVDSVVSYESFQKHVQRGSTRLLNRVSFLFFLQCEVIGVDQATEFIAGRLKHSDFNELEANLPPLEAIDSELPAPWWDACCDKCLLLGVLKHGWEKYTSMRLDPSLCFWFRAKNNMSSQQASSEFERSVLAMDETQSIDTKNATDSKMGFQSLFPSINDKCPIDHPGNSTDDVDAPHSGRSTPSKDIKSDESPVIIPSDNTVKALAEEDMEEECDDEDVEDGEQRQVPLRSGDVDGTTTGNSDHSLLEALPFPAVADLNNRARKLVSYFQRIKNHMDAEELRMNRQMVGDDDEQGIRTPLSRFVQNRIVKWTRREEADFYRVVSSFGVEFTPSEVVSEAKQESEAQSSAESRALRDYRWLNFRQLANVNRKSDEALTEYFHAFYRMCQKVCKRQLTEFTGPVTTASTTTTFGSCEPGSEVPIEPISEERANRCLSRIDLLIRIRNHVLPHPELKERLCLCQRSSDMPGWWVAGLHDGELLRAAAKHGLARTDFNMLSDREFSFSRIIQLIRDKLSTNAVVLDYVGDLGANQSATTRAIIAAAAATAAQAAADEVVAKIAPQKAETFQVDRGDKKEHSGEQPPDEEGTKVESCMDQKSPNREDLKCDDETELSSRAKEEEGEKSLSGRSTATANDQVPPDANSVMNEWSVKFATNLATAWPKDRTVQHRLEMVCQAIETNEWPTPRRYAPIPSVAGIPVADPNRTLNESRILKYSSTISAVRTHGMAHDTFANATDNPNSLGLTYMSQQMGDKQPTDLTTRKFLDSPRVSGDHLNEHDQPNTEETDSLSTHFQLPLNLTSNSSHQNFAYQLPTSDTLATDFTVGSPFSQAAGSKSRTGLLSPFASTCSSKGEGGTPTFPASTSSHTGSPPSTPPPTLSRGRGRGRGRSRGARTSNSRGPRSVDSSGGGRQTASPQSSISGGSDSSGHGNKLQGGDGFSSPYQSARSSGSTMPPPDMSTCYRPSGPSRRRRSCHPRSSRDLASGNVRLPQSRGEHIGGGHSDESGVTSPRVARGRRSVNNSPSSSSSQEVWNVRVPVINMMDGSLIYGEKAPKRRCLEAWLENNPNYMPYSVEVEDRAIYNRVASSRGQEVNNMEMLAYRHYLSSLLTNAAAAAASTPSTPSYLLHGKGAVAPANVFSHHHHHQHHHHQQQQQQYLQQQQLLATLSAYARHPAYASMISSALANLQTPTSSSVLAAISTTGVNPPAPVTSPMTAVSLNSSATTETVSSRTRAADPVPVVASTSAANTVSMGAALSDAYKQASNSLNAYMYNPLMAAAAYSQMMLAAAAASSSTSQVSPSPSPAATPAPNASIQNQYQQQQAILASLYANYLSSMASASMAKPSVATVTTTTATPPLATAVTASAPVASSSTAPAWEAQRQQMTSFAAAIAAACGNMMGTEASTNSLAAMLASAGAQSWSSQQQQPTVAISSPSRDDRAVPNSSARPQSHEPSSVTPNSPGDTEAAPSGASGAGGDDLDADNPNDQSHCILDLSK